MGKKLSVGEVFAILLGAIIGWGSFMLPGTQFCLSLVPLNATAFPLVIDKLFHGVLNWGHLYTIAGDPVYLGKFLVSVIIVLLFTALNLKGMKQSGEAQFWIVAALVACVVAVFVGMLFRADLNAFQRNYVDIWSFDLGQVAEVVAITPFLFLGFDAVPQLVKDMDISRHKASVMAVASLLIGMSCYILWNFAAGLAYGPQEAYEL